MLPAALLMICMLVAAYLVAIKRGYPAGTFPGWSAVLWSMVGALPGLFVVAIILVGILSGVFTATESAAIAVIYALALTIFVYRSLSWPNFLKAAAKAVKTTGIVLLLIGVSNTFGYLITLYEVADLTGKSLASLSTDPWVIFFLVNLILFVLGTFLDMAATILICTPIFLPICMQYGMGPVQFGMLMLINCALGLNTPPVGTTQFVGLRHRRRLGGPGDADHPALLRRADRRALPGDLRAGLLAGPAQAIPRQVLASGSPAPARRPRGRRARYVP